MTATAVGARDASARPTGGSVGVLLPLIADSYFSGILAGIVEEAYEQGLDLLVWSTLHEHAREVALRRRVQQTTDGALLVLPEESSQELLAAASDGPLVVVDTLLALDERVPTVTVANASGADQATRHLIALGHRRIAAITGPPGWVASDARLSAYEAALTRAGLSVDPELVVRADFELAPGAEAARALFDLPDPPTAVFAFNDPIALGALRAAHERGLRVPDDVSIVGFDDWPVATAVTPALTTVRQPLAEMGHAALNLLLRLARTGEREQIHVELPTRLVIRGSTSAPKPGALRKP